jgi:AcrR family transcriptional regulator
MKQISTIESAAGSGAAAGSGGAKEPGTREKLLDAAEALVAEHGFDRVSVRDITSAAGVNLATVSYHFGSRDALLDALIARYIAPINLDRLRLLDVHEQLCGEKPVPLLAILDAFVRPMLEQAVSGGQSERLFYKMLGRCMSERSYRLPDELAVVFETVAARFSQALQRVLPEIPQKVLMWRLHFVFGTIAQTLVHAETFIRITNGRAGKPTADEVFNYLMSFCAAGLRAPLSPEESAAPRAATRLH